MAAGLRPRRHGPGLTAAARGCGSAKDASLAPAPTEGEEGTGMGLLSVIVAALAGFGVGAAWYMALSGP